MKCILVCIMLFLLKVNCFSQDNLVTKSVIGKWEISAIAIENFMGLNFENLDSSKRAFLRMLRREKKEELTKTDSIMGSQVLDSIVHQMTGSYIEFINDSIYVCKISMPDTPHSLIKGKYRLDPIDNTIDFYENDLNQGQMTFRNLNGQYFSFSVQTDDNKNFIVTFKKVK